MNLRTTIGGSIRYAWLLSISRHASNCYAIQTAKEELYKLEGLEPGSEEFTNLLNRMMQQLHHHNDDEEIDDLPLLEPAIGEVASKEAAMTFKKTKKFVPTRFAY